MMQWAKKYTAVGDAQSLRHNVYLFIVTCAPHLRLVYYRRLLASQPLVVMINIDKPKRLSAKKKTLLQAPIIFFLCSKVKTKASHYTENKMGSHGAVAHSIQVETVGLSVLVRNGLMAMVCHSA